MPKSAASGGQQYAPKLPPVAGEWLVNRHLLSGTKNVSSPCCLLHHRRQWRIIAYSEESALPVLAHGLVSIGKVRRKDGLPCRLEFGDGHSPRLQIRGEYQAVGLSIEPHDFGSRQKSQPLHSGQV